MNKEGEYEVARSRTSTIEWAFANSYPGWVWSNTGVVTPLNEWTHIVITYDYGIVTTYVNSLAMYRFNGTGTIGDYHTDMNEFWIGERQGYASGSLQNFQGRIDEVSIYSQALDQEAVQAMYLGTFDEDGDSVDDTSDVCPGFDDHADADEAGDVCDTDDEGDGVFDAANHSLVTALGAAVDAEGCFIPDLASCESTWKNHGAYVKAVQRVAKRFVELGLLTSEEHGEIVSATA